MSYSGVSILTEIMRPANKSVTQMAVTILTMLSLHSGQHYYPYSHPINYCIAGNFRMMLIFVYFVCSIPYTAKV